MDAERGFGGTEISVVRYSKALTEMGHDVWVFSKNTRPGRYDGVQWRLVDEVDQMMNADVTIYFKRVPEFFEVPAPLRAVVLMDRSIPEHLGEWLKSGKINMIMPTSKWQYECARATVEAPDNVWFQTGHIR